MDEVAAIQGKIGDLLLGDHLAERRIRGLNGYLFCAYFHGLADRRGVKREINLALFVDLQANVLLLRGLEALGFHSDGVNRHGQQRCDVVT